LAESANQVLRQDTRYAFVAEREREAFVAERERGRERERHSLQREREREAERERERDVRVAKHLRYLQTAAARRHVGLWARACNRNAFRLFYTPKTI
jgi:hypothetical protein